MIINDTFLFIHIPKTGGTSVRSSLEHLDTREPKTLKSRAARILGRRLPWQEARFRRHDDLQTVHTVASGVNMFTFAVVRNPYDHAVSHFRHMRTRNRNRRYADQTLNMTLAQFLAWREKSAKPISWIENKNLRFATIPSQFDFLTLDGRLAADRVLRLETLNDDFAQLCEDLGLGPIQLPRKNVNKTAANVELDPLSIEIINRLYKPDFDTFGYQQRSR
ncbi:sulfotransferase family 2 domain-containing protein [Thalassorhabdomicrobium marinisediminis]|uniref:Sulfotransferase family protein n=1 Tax=Thalassorhabdomicrobium marinisediminis TaxID=2170577 RepID=A0A2T7FW92_9RHOB|nr:sulfotransferase family 2 domain-containing protein [Thalassorhabdomicrobium marinisediminis]PVA06445.1 hypothetical protein DC363_11120 [Thalassorhabdomicrobium marinisediminis]